MDRVWQVRCKWVKCVASGSSASQVGQVRRKCVKCVASGSSASQVGQTCFKSKCVKWVKCVASGASGSNRLIIPTPEQVCQVCQHTSNQLLVPVCTRIAIFPETYQQTPGKTLCMHVCRFKNTHVYPYTQLNILNIIHTSRQRPT